MEGEAFEAFDELDHESLIEGALQDARASQVEHFRAMTRYSQNPSEKNVAVFNETSLAAGESLKMSASIISTCTDLTARDRAEHITGLCLGAEQARLDLLRKIIPAGNFLDPSQTPNEVADIFEEIIEAGAEPTEVGEQVYENYRANYSKDLNEFLTYVSPSKRVVWMSAAKRTGVEIGKLAAGAALGSLAAHHILKKFDNKKR
jgi:hypothetical protein